MQYLQYKGLLSPNTDLCSSDTLSANAGLSI